ncbi:hypothetical protein N7462_002997 [Penicillium macrosclerotiorum]|uniref:uncharacterized protein n=1 Tax=Penicillium macrosclerotiorum TaxID=303699 RepID=UPI002548C0C6|nr:uncharacterized protein N7462_002997 [Penicillium macrosclerotiorum]KAJ5688605.1 hypothetical protein N7462_002997 [Penicillium macrosclerotiorum]
MVRACEFCRRRKIRCDATKPACSACRNSNRVCVYHNGPQKQRPSAALINLLKHEKAALEDTLSRLKNADDAQRRVLLQSVIVQNGQVSLSERSTPSTMLSSSSPPPPHEPFRTTAHQRGCREEQQLMSHPMSHPRYAQSAPRITEDEANGAYVEDDDHRDDDRNPTLERDHELVMSSRQREAICSAGEATLTEKSHEASDSIFSSTSVVHDSSPIGPVDPNATRREEQEAATELLRYQLIANAAMERQREHRLRRLTSIRGIPAELALHLLDLHWSRQHHTFLLTYRPAFMRELENGGPYCSDLLLYAVFACASKFSERPEVRSNSTDPETAGRSFFTRCDELLLREGHLIQSKVPTVIALVMLGSTFIARGMTSKGWLYTGYAIRMVYDLGLHIDSQEVNKHNVEEVEIRRRVFWGAFVCEKLQSLYLGRPPTIRLQDVHVSQEFLDTFEELEPWEPTHDSTTAESGSSSISSLAPSTHSVTVFQQLCRLAQIMTRIIDRIYFTGATASKTLHEVRPLDDVLAAWYRDLPAHLSYEPWSEGPDNRHVAVSPNRIILLTTYYSLIVLLHRPFITMSSKGTSNHGNTATIGTSAYSWRRCTTASQHITSLVLSYQSIYPLYKSSYLLSYAVYVACTIHVLNTASLSAGGDSKAFAESSSLLSASLSCLDALSVPNLGAADTALIIRKLMAAKGVQESSAPVELQPPPHQFTENGWQMSNFSPIFEGIGTIPMFQDIYIPGEDLLFGFMSENASLAAFDMNETIS